MKRVGCIVHKIEYDKDTGALTVGITGKPKMRRLRNLLFALFDQAEYLTITDGNRVIKRGPIRRMSDDAKDYFRRGVKSKPEPEPTYDDSYDEYLDHIKVDKVEYFDPRIVVSVRNGAPMQRVRISCAICSPTPRTSPSITSIPASAYGRRKYRA